MRDCRPGMSCGIQNAFDHDPTHTLGSPTPPSLGSGLRNTQLYQTPFEMDGAEAVASGKNSGVVCHALLRGIFLIIRMEPKSLMSPALEGGFFSTSTT